MKQKYREIYQKIIEAAKIKAVYMKDIFGKQAWAVTLQALDELLEDVLEGEDDNKL